MKNSKRKFSLKISVVVIVAVVLCVLGLTAQAQMASTGEAPIQNYTDTNSAKATEDATSATDTLNVTLTADGETTLCSTSAKTVSQLLTEVGVVLGEFDMVTPEEEEALFDGAEIVVQRVEYREEIETQVVDYEFITEETSSLESGTTQIKQYGIEGERTIVTNNMYVDGVLAESVVISDEITTEPVNQIRLVGTGKSNTLDYSSSSSSKRRTSSSLGM